MQSAATHAAKRGWLDQQPEWTRCDEEKRDENGLKSVQVEKYRIEFNAHIVEARECIHMSNRAPQRLAAAFEKKKKKKSALEAGGLSSSSAWRAVRRLTSSPMHSVVANQQRDAVVDAGKVAAARSGANAPAASAADHAAAHSCASSASSETAADWSNEATYAACAGVWLLARLDTRRADPCARDHGAGWSAATRSAAARRRKTHR